MINRYSATEFAFVVKIPSSKIYRLSRKLEEKGYRFTKSGEKRIYTEREVFVFKQILKYQMSAELFSPKNVEDAMVEDALRAVRNLDMCMNKLSDLMDAIEEKVYEAEAIANHLLNLI